MSSQEEIRNLNLEKWKKWDWEKQDIALAREHGLSRERIRQIRKIVGAPQSPTFHQWTDPLHKRIAEKVSNYDWMTKNNIEIIKKYNLDCSSGYLSSLRKQFGKPRSVRKFYFERQLPKWENVDWCQSVDRIAQALKVSKIAVLKKRQKLLTTYFKQKDLRSLDETSKLELFQQLNEKVHK